MSFRALLRSIADGFPAARAEKFGGHPLAAKVRQDWPEGARQLVGGELDGQLRVMASPGLGQWSEAPWLAVLHAQVTGSAMAGFYPVYLYEPGFTTVCLVMGQGAQSLTESVGKKAALAELQKRAELLRANGGRWREAGFEVGPFQTLKSVASASSSVDSADAWSVATAFGKRYRVDDLPADEVLKADLVAMLKLYSAMAINPLLSFVQIDDQIELLKGEGEMPEGSVDGAKQVVEHKKFETRTRDRKLVKAVKARLGLKCQACGFKFSERYGSSMADYIEVHHKVPLSTAPDLGRLLKPTEEDFMVLCSNCHRAIHRAGCPDLETFRSQLR